MSCEKGDPEIELWALVGALLLFGALVALFVYLFA